MDIALKIVVSLIALLFLFMGGSLMLTPAAAVAGFAVSPEGADGLNTVRADLGGMFLFACIVLVLGLMQRRAECFLAVALLMALIAAGRLLGFVVDGSPGPQPIQYFVAEVVIVGLLVLAGRRLAARPG